jgi:hypothetical protein
MDPYLEEPHRWPGFHNDLAAEIRAALNRQIQPRYYADLDSYLTYDVIEVARTEPRSIYPDLAVLQPQPLRSQEYGSIAAVAPAPAESSVPLEISISLDRVEVRTVGDDLLIAVIEILSPVNKRPSHEAFGEYQRKRRAMLRSQAHLLEIDLLRAGTRPPLEKPVPPAPYYVTLGRVTRRPTIEVWPIQLAEALPVVPVPLFEPDPDAVLDLGAVVASVYERGAYGSRLDYRKPPPPPPLSEEESAWMTALLQKRGVVPQGEG